MATKVIVQNVYALANYADNIKKLKSDLELNSSDLFKMFELVSANLATLTALTNTQKKNWMDPQFDALQMRIEQCINAVNSTSLLVKEASLTLNTQLAEIEKSILYVNKLVSKLKEINTYGAATVTANSFSRHLSPVEVSNRWETAVQSINEQIENYREALNQRGVPDCKWLDKTLAAHRAAMLEQEAYELDVASGHGADSIHNSDAYLYPGDYSAFYDQLVGKFRTHCAEATNPNYNSEEVNQWYINCQRCVPTYEMLRRGLDVTALPCDGGYDYLASHPFSVWENANVISCIGQGKSEIEAAMNSWGDGARAQITVMWTRTSGHTFLAEQRGGRTYFIDPQSGNENYLDWIDSAIPGMTQFCRIDNLDTSPFINHCYREV